MNEIRNTTILLGERDDPWRNLALEECLLDAAAPGCALMYLWQNRQTVVIGRHQNPWRECRCAQLEQDGGKLARRITGGGAVYHDLGNLNFSFIAPPDTYDVRRQLSVVLAAVRALGVEAEFSGRNDLLTQGRKFSGNAFAHRANASLHHGTLMLNVDTAPLSRYLQVSLEKLQSKGIRSVRSRVVNLCELNPAITVRAMIDALCAAFEREYGPAERLDQATVLADARVQEVYERHASWQWRYGQSPQFEAQLQTRFAWGGVELHVQSRDGLITTAQIYSDAMDERFISWLGGALHGVRFAGEPMAQAVAAYGTDKARELAQWLTTQQL